MTALWALPVAKKGSSLFQLAQTDTMVGNFILSSTQDFSQHPLQNQPTGIDVIRQLQQPPLDYCTLHHSFDENNRSNVEHPGLYVRDILSQSPSLIKSGQEFRIMPEYISSSLASHNDIDPRHYSQQDDDKTAISIEVSSPLIPMRVSNGEVLEDSKSYNESFQHVQKKRLMLGDIDVIDTPNISQGISSLIKEKESMTRSVSNSIIKHKVSKSKDRSRLMTLFSNDRKKLAKSKLNEITTIRISVSESVKREKQVTSKPKNKAKIAISELDDRKKQAISKPNDRAKIEISNSDDKTRLATYQALYSTCSLPKSHADKSSENIVYIMHQDDIHLSPYQCLIRMQIEYFEAAAQDVYSTMQGRNKPISLHQVGIRCRFCSMYAPWQRTRGSTYYPTKLEGIYQACQNLASVHLSYNCPLIPESLRTELLKSRVSKSSNGSGKHYWAVAAKAKGIFESNDILLILKKKDTALK